MSPLAERNGPVVHRKRRPCWFGWEEDDELTDDKEKVTCPACREKS